MADDAVSVVQARINQLKRLGVDELADRILDPPVTKVTFLGETLQMVPVPALLAKQVRKQVGAFYAKAPSPEDITANPEILADYESKLGDLFFEIVQTLLGYYQVKKSLTEIEAAPIGESLAFLEVQVEVNGEQDFLLRPLRRLLRIYASHGGSLQGNDRSPSSSPAGPSANSSASGYVS